MLKMEKKMGLFSRIFNSMTRIEAYKYFIKQPLRKAILYLFLVSILFWCISGIKIVIGINAGVNEGIKYFETELPDFQLKNGELEVDAEMPYVIAEEENKLYVIDTSQSIDETVLDKYEGGFFISKNGAIYKKNIFETRRFNFSSLQDTVITKNDVLGWLPYLKWLCVVFVVFTVPIYFLGKIISAFIVSICGIVIEKIFRCRLGFKNLYKISIYALTFPMLMAALLDLSCLSIPYFSVMYYGIALIYVWMVIKTLKEQGIDTTDWDYPQNRDHCDL